jgi:hypothetical protein
MSINVTTPDGGTTAVLLEEVEGYVWCDKEGCVHSDCLNPYGYVEDGKQDYCTPELHRKLYMEPL